MDTCPISRYSMAGGMLRDQMAGSDTLRYSLMQDTESAAEVFMEAYGSLA